MLTDLLCLRFSFQTIQTNWEDQMHVTDYEKLCTQMNRNRAAQVKAFHVVPDMLGAKVCSLVHVFITHGSLIHLLMHSLDTIH